MSNKSVEWSYFDKFSDIVDKYMPYSGEGTTKASQLVTAINKLIYKWYNDGDVFDNTSLNGWTNDLSSYANWIYNHYNTQAMFMERVKKIDYEDEYEQLLKELADIFLVEGFLEIENRKEAQDTIYECNGIFEFTENENEEDY